LCLKNKYNGHFYAFPDCDFYFCMKYMVVPYQISMEPVLGYIYIEKFEKLRPAIKTKKNIWSGPFFEIKTTVMKKHKWPLYLYLNSIKNIVMMQML